jgi:apolipoprotein D and lipocalin family protein
MATVLLKARLGGWRRLLPAVVALLLAGCTGLPDGVQPVRGFEVDRYLGTWYEIARLDHSFERGLSRVTATYSLRDDGGIDVLNRGFDAASGEWKEAQGRAYFVDGPDTGHLKVSFFGPFYGSYAVFGLDRETYGHAFVSGYDTDYLWLLAREPVVADDVLADFKAQAAARGFDIKDLIIVRHD